LAPYEKRELKRIFGSKREKQHNRMREEIAYCGASLNIIRTMKIYTMCWIGYAVHIGEKRIAYQVLVGKS
jgi:hypothetical protein